MKLSPALKARYPNLKTPKTKPQFLVWLLHENPYELLKSGDFGTECIIASKLLKKFPNWDFWQNLNPVLKLKPKHTFASLKIPLKKNSFYYNIISEEYETYASSNSQKYIDFIEKKAKVNDQENKNTPETGDPNKIKKKFDFLE